MKSIVVYYSRTNNTKFVNTKGIGREMLFLGEEPLYKALKGTRKNLVVDSGKAQLVHFRPTKEAIAQKKDFLYLALQNGVPPSEIPQSSSWKELNEQRNKYKK